MMIRSAPPASANFAESPVPAPAPMIGDRASTCARRRRSDSSRGSSCRLLDQLVQPVGHRDRERRVVDVLVELVQLDPPPSVSLSGETSASSASAS